MEPLACSGTCAIAGHPIQLAFQDAIHSVTPSSQPADLYLAPGFIDLQVNGFAGVDYNAPRTPHAEIARSLRARISTSLPASSISRSTALPASITTPRGLPTPRSPVPSARSSLPASPASTPP